MLGWPSRDRVWPRDATLVSATLLPTVWSIGWRTVAARQDAALAPPRSCRMLVHPKDGPQSAPHGARGAGSATLRIGGKGPNPLSTMPTATSANGTKPQIAEPGCSKDGFKPPSCTTKGPHGRGAPGALSFSSRFFLKLMHPHNVLVGPLCHTLRFRIGRASSARPCPSRGVRAKTFKVTLSGMPGRPSPGSACFVGCARSAAFG